MNLNSPTKSWRLNERHYGSLEGTNKKESESIYGKEQVLEWRRSYYARPPPKNQEFSHNFKGFFFKQIMFR